VDLPPAFYVLLRQLLEYSLVTRVEDIEDLLLGTWNAVKNTEDGKERYGAEEGTDPPYYGKLAKVLSRKFGDVKKAHDAKATAAAAGALLAVAEDDAENVLDNVQDVAIASQE
jgi:hypothetical protein